MTSFPTPRRNFSPWYQVVSRLMATEAADPLVVDDRAGFEAWRDRFLPRLEDCSGTVARSVSPSTWRSPRRCRATAICAESGRLRHRGDHVGAGLSAGPRRRRGTGVRPCWPCTATVRASPAICGVDDPDAAPGSDYAAELARRGYVVLAPDLRCFGERADWNPPDHYACDTNLVHQVMGGWNPLTQNLWDLARALDVLESHPLVDPARARHGRVLLRRARRRCSWPHWTTGCRWPWSAGTSPRGRSPTRCRGTCAGPRCCPACSDGWSTSTWPP